MVQKISSVDAVLKALPAVQEAVREEIAARIAAGEKIAGIDKALEAKLEKRKRDLLEKLMPQTMATGRAGAQSRQRKTRRSAA